jgi:pyruvate,water dikinase
MTALEFRAPDASTWELDPVHQPRPWTRFMAEIYAEPFARGFAAGTREHGLLLDRRRISFIHGFGYLSLDLVSPTEIPERIGQLVTLFERKPWRAALREWDATEKPRAIAANRALAAIEPRELSDDALVAHLARCREHIADMVYTHMRYTVAALLPVGDFLAHAREWTGKSFGELLALLRGASPISSGASPERDRVVAALRARGGGVAEGGLPALLAEPGELGAAARAWIELVGWRPLDGMDVADACAMEAPGLLVNTLASALEVAPATSATDVAVPAEHRAAFDALLAEARLVYRLRDERGLYTDVWAAGTTRRALLVAGERLARARRVAEVGDVVEADWTELRALLAGGGPPADELAARAAFRTSHTASDAPMRLGPEPHLPPLDALPPPARRAVIAMMTALQALFAETDRAPDRSTLHGHGASAGSYQGTARVIRDPSELGRLRRGDVLVASSTSEAFNLALPLLGAIVTDRGGTLSHAAIVAREFGIPCVVGTRKATTMIRDGARIRVDGAAGEVHLLD